MNACLQSGKLSINQSINKSFSQSTLFISPVLILCDENTTDRKKKEVSGNLRNTKLHLTLNISDQYYIRFQICKSGLLVFIQNNHYEANKKRKN